MDMYASFLNQYTVHKNIVFDRVKSENAFVSSIEYLDVSGIFNK